MANELVGVRCDAELLAHIDRLKRTGESRPDFVRRCVARVVEGERLRALGADVKPSGRVVPVRSGDVDPRFK